MPRSILVITGAGASTALGRDDRPIPLMQGWATTLCDQLGVRAQQIGLKPNMQGDQFEAALGRFLAFGKSLPIVDQLLHLGTPGNPTTQRQKPHMDWVQTANNAVYEITLNLHRNLYECFGGNRVDHDRAKNAYYKLHHDALCWDVGDARIWHATTNFDPALEIAIDLDRGSFKRVDGFTHPAGGVTSMYEPEEFEKLAAEDDNLDQVPVIHLHGKVGWYYDGQNNIFQDPPDRDFDARQTPALLLPDDAKNPETNFTPGLDATWTVFESVMRRATHILVLGHSLNDKHLVDTLKGWSGKNIAVVVYRDSVGEGDRFAPATPEEKAHLNQLLGRDVEVIPGSFGLATTAPADMLVPYEDDFDMDLLQDWSRRL